MKIDRLELCNFRGFSNLQFVFHGKLNLFVGANGSGKSSVMVAIATALSWLVNRIQREHSNGSQIAESDLRNGSEKGYIDIHVDHGTTSYRWYLTKSARGSKNDPASYAGVSAMAERIRESYHDNSILPVIAYYPVSRVVDRVVPDVSSREAISDLDVYEKALSGKSNFHALFDWFYHQDSILNEKSLSRSKWMRSHKLWTRKRVNNILAAFEKLFPMDDEHSKEELRHMSKMFKDEFILDEPRMLFIELSHLMHRFESKTFMEYEMPMHDIEDMLYNMASLSKESRDDLIEDDEHFFHIIHRTVKPLRRSRDNVHQEDSKNKPLQFIWETFSFAILLSLWWMSDKGRRKVENLLRETFSSIQRKKTFELEDGFTEQLRKIVKDDISFKKPIQRNEGKELNFVRKAIEAFIPDYKNLQVKRVPRPRMELTKNGESFDLNQLSDGEKTLIALIGDIARRLTMANPNMDNPLEGAGIILADGIDLHLHPRWQHIVTQKMPELFPNCQFFISTYSPQVISHVKPESIFVLENNNGEIVQHSVVDSYGKSSNQILEDIMDETARPKYIDDEIKFIFKMIQDGKIDDAQKKIFQLQPEIGEDSEFVKAGVLIKRREIIGK